MLPPGAYRIEVGFPGFKRMVREGVLLQVDQNAVVDLTLSIGAFSEEIVVVGNVPLLNTRSAGLGTVMDNAKVVEVAAERPRFLSAGDARPGRRASGGGIAECIGGRRGQH